MNWEEKCRALREVVLELKANNLAMRSASMHCPRCNDTGDQRYWEGRWRDEKAENEQLAEKVRHLTKLLDDQVGTPCEQIRHSEEKAELHALNAELLALLQRLVEASDRQLNALPVIEEARAAIDRTKERK